MSVGDDIFLTEETYKTIIGELTASIAIVQQRNQAKDREIARLESENAKLKERLSGNK